MPRLFPLSFCLPLLCLLLGACSTARLDYRFATVAAKPLPAQQAALLGTVQEVDITPPPGLPKAGFSTWAENGDGFRTRLKARVFYLRPKGGQPLVLIQSDLLAGSEILHAALASRLARFSEIAPQNLVLAANHTHAAPGQYFGSDFYNLHASNAGGFDPHWFEFLAGRLEQAVLRARDGLRPARIAVGQREVWGLTRNRSLEPYLANPEVTDKTTTLFEAINPALTLVRIDLQEASGAFRPAGAFASFSIHGTGIGSDTGFYHADVWAYIANEAAWRVQQHYGLTGKPVLGAFEATHGDVAPNERPGQIGYAEARRVGTAIGQQAFALFNDLDKQLRDDLPLRSALREVDVLARPEIGTARLCQPAAGAALAAGAHEHRSPLIWYLPFIHPGQPRTFFTDTCQGAKHWLGGAWLQPLILPTEQFPHRLLLQTLQIGDSYWAMLPFEVTTMSGRQIETRMRATLKDAGIQNGMVVVSSVANGYTGYVTTSAEYGLQHYEGGHTLYGPQTAPFLAAHSAELLGGMLARGSFAELPHSRDFSLASRHFWPQGGAPSPRRLLRPAQRITPSAPEEPYWEIRWRDQAPADMAFDQPLLTIEVQRDGRWQPLHREGRPEDDQGFDLAVQWLGGRDYAARWYNPPASLPNRLRLFIAPRGEQPALAVPIADSDLELTDQ